MRRCLGKKKKGKNGFGSDSGKKTYDHQREDVRKWKDARGFNPRGGGTGIKIYGS